jgi:pimeloyl-ACP methyl ester carboxylesterase
MQGDPSLILFSGMGADDRVFGPQREAFPHLIVPTWPAPRPDDTLPAYAARLAKQVNPGRPCFVGGASFGGMIAMEVARHLPNVLGCFVIGSVRSPRELPARLRLMRPAARLVRFIPFELLPPVTRGGVALMGRFSSPATRGFLNQVSGADAAFLRWASHAVVTWEAATASPGFPIHQIHGDRDRILPWRRTRPDVLVRGAGHVLTLSHPKDVNDFLSSRMREAR